MFPVAILTLAVAGIANAQGAPGGGLGITNSTPVTRQAADSMVAQIVHPVDGQIARYSDGICPVAIGVNEQFSGRVADRIRNVAETAGAPVAAQPCEGNLLVFFVNSPAEFFQSVEREHPAWLRSLSRYSRKQLAASNEPILAWHLTTRTNGEGEGSHEDVSASQPVPTMRVRDSSIVQQVTRQTIESAFVVVSLSAIDGRPIYQIADNIALQALTSVDVPQSSQVSTVLTALKQEPAKAPAMMTAADLAFLRALYAGDGEQNASSERRRLAEAMAGELSG
jgi:hypothetical protein